MLNVLSWGIPAFASTVANEAQIKAAYLYNFAKFITWPKKSFIDKKSSFVIGVFGENELNGSLKPLTAKTVCTRPIVIKYFQSIDEKIDACHILYLKSTDPDQQRTLLKALEKKPVMTVGAENDFAAQGGIIQFVSVRGRLRFIINLEAAQQAEIKINSQLLSLAIEVLEKTK